MLSAAEIKKILIFCKTGSFSHMLSNLILTSIHSIFFFYLNSNIRSFCFRTHYYLHTYMLALQGLQQKGKESKERKEMRVMKRFTQDQSLPLLIFIAHANKNEHILYRTVRSILPHITSLQACMHNFYTQVMITSLLCKPET